MQFTYNRKLQQFLYITEMFSIINVYKLNHLCIAQKPHTSIEHVNKWYEYNQLTNENK